MPANEKLQSAIQKEIIELTESIAGVVASFKDLQRPLSESHKQVPQATNQLDKITEQTEAVTARMLDTVELVTQREEEVIRGLEEINKAVEAGKVESLPQMVADLTDKAGANLNDVYSIMDSLQFQDITAQQMDHAASLLEDVEKKLHNILQTIGIKSGQPLEAEAPSKKERAFDPHADFGDKKADQVDIDNLFAKQGK